MSHKILARARARIDRQVVPLIIKLYFYI